MTTSSSPRTSSSGGCLPATGSGAPRASARASPRTTLHGGSDYRFEFSDDAPMADMWVYEDLISPLRKNIASAGFPREEMSLTSLTYDEIRPGCFDPVERLKDMDVNWVEASLCFPTFPRFCGQTFNEAKDKEVALACVRAYNDWMVEEWCGDSGGRLIPLIIIPLWDVATRGARDRTQRRPWRARGDLQRAAGQARPAVDPHRLLGPVLRGVCRQRRRRQHAHRLVVVDGDRVARRAARGADHAQLQLRAGVDVRLPVLRLVRALPQAQGGVLRGADGLDPVRPAARRRRVARAPRLGRRRRRAARAAVDLLLLERLRLLLPRRRSASR